MHDSTKKKIGEVPFAAALLVLSLLLLWQAYEISGFEGLSSPGAFPMAAAFVMVVSSAMILIHTVRIQDRDDARLGAEVLPPAVVVMIVLIGLYAVLLQWLGFLPTSLIFLTVGITYLKHGSPLQSFLISLGALIGIYVLFRVVFSVLMPAGIVPEGEILAWFGNLFSGGSAEQ